MIKAKKSLGQNFLKSTQIIGEIIKTADLKIDDVVLEVGPGEGVLTEKLLEEAKRVVAIEKDQRLIGFLEKKFKKFVENKQLTLVYGDILKIKNSDLFKNYKIKNYKIIANIPYYITGQFLRKFLSTDFQPNKVVIMLQKEVAQRITSQKESILSLSVKAYGKPKYIITVKAENFSPQPKIDSAILLIDDISKDFFKNIDEKYFFQIVKIGFSSKRKMLKKNLSFIPKNELTQIFTKLKIPLKIRSEDLSLQEWGNLTKSIH